MTVKIWMPENENIEFACAEDDSRSEIALNLAQYLISHGHTLAHSPYSPNTKLVDFGHIDYPSNMRVYVNGKRMKNVNAVERMVWSFQDILNEWASKHA